MNPIKKQNQNKEKYRKGEGGRIQNNIYLLVGFGSTKLQLFPQLNGCHEKEKKKIQL